MRSRFSPGHHMRRISMALVCVSISPGPVSAQSSVVECAKSSGGIQIVTSDRQHFRWYFPSDILTARFNDCVARKAAAPTPSPSAKAAPKRSH
jgi:hypothetical protein